ncbi:hypothetical protein Tco_0375775 [Tanacetum coccineum]
MSRKKIFEIQEDLQARIKILEKDVQRCEKKGVDFQLKLQHEKEKQKWDSTLKNKISIPLDYSWISKMEKLEDENNGAQTQKEMNELIVHVSEKTYAYGAIRAENQNLLTTISELKKRLTKAKKKSGCSQKENNVESKPVTLQLQLTKQTREIKTQNVIRPGMPDIDSPETICVFLADAEEYIAGGLQFLGGKLVSWSSKKQDCTAMSTAEAEYVSLSACCAQEDRLKYRLKFMLDKKELTLTIDDFRQIFHLPQATANNHNAFVPPPSFSDMVPFYKKVLGFTMELKT